MGLGGVANAVLPSVVYPKQSFSDRLGGVEKIIPETPHNKRLNLLNELIF